MRHDYTKETIEVIKTIRSSKRLKQPTPEMIRIMRHASGLSKREAAELVYRGSYSIWNNWETGKNNIPLGLWELFLIKTKIINL